MLPLAPLSDEARGRLPEVLRRIEKRVSETLTPSEAGDLRTATYVLMGLRYRPDQIRTLYEGMSKMKESATHQAILAEGREEGREEGSFTEAQRFLLVVGTEWFGEPAPEVRARILAERGVERLEELGRRVPRAKRWEDLFVD
jgi:predicted transposase YdaD